MKGRIVFPMSEGMRFAFFVFDSFLENEAKPKHLQRIHIRLYRLRRFEGDLERSLLIIITRHHHTTTTLTLRQAKSLRRLSVSPPLRSSQTRGGYKQEP